MLSTLRRLTGVDRLVATYLFVACICLIWVPLTGCGGSDGRPDERPPRDFSFRLSSAIQTDTMTLAYDKASIEKGRPTKVTTSSEQWSFAASMPIVMDRTMVSRRYIQVRAQVLSGQIGIGILQRDSNSFLTERVVDPTPQMQDIFVRLDSPVHADDLVIRNTAAERSQILIDSVSVLAKAKLLPGSLSPGTMRLSYNKAAIERGSPVVITTAPEQWAYAAALPLNVKAEWGPGVVLRIRAQVLSGRVGFGALTPDGKSFAVEQMIDPSAQVVEVDLPLRGPLPVAELIVRNVAPGNVRSRVAVQSLEFWKLD